MSASRTLLNKQGRKHGPLSRARWEIPASRATRMAGKAPSLVQRALMIAKGEGRTATILRREQAYRDQARQQAHDYGGTPVA
ncbi:hypothetical protein CPT_Percy12 [Caulobacter phage Percy]|uniref:Uncharacterized protein n=1 Tax=Caulobacter phage Percy TaxID=1701809 RepID=A0A0M4R1U6_9CAUD|nr:hypothetical protein CPT_Percy12 [Caulobacter phage Percy]ALF01646.1 hypothetical protein CPT_Percy12 [Caulobacter phage Percy]